MLTPFLENLSLILIVLGITLRPLIPGSQIGLGFSLFINLFIWSGFFLWFGFAHHPELAEGWLLNRDRRNEYRIIHPSAAGGFFIIIFGLLTLVSPLIAFYKLAALPYSINWLTDLAIFVFMLNLAAGDKNHIIRLFIWGLLSTAVVIAVYAVYQYYNLDTLKEFLTQRPDLMASLPPELLNEFFNRLNANEPFATFIYQNALAGWLVLIWPVLLGLTLSFSLRKNRFALALNIIFLGIMGFVIYATGSKGGWAAFIMSLLIFGLLAGWSRLAKFYRIIFSAALLLVFCGMFIVFLLSLAGKISLQTTPGDLWSSLQIRFDYWRGAWQVIKENMWFGVGLDNFSGHYLQFKDAFAGETSKAHNDFLQIWTELGIFGIIAFLGAWFVILLKPIRGILNPPPALPSNGTETNRSLSGNFIIGAILAFLISQLFAGTFQLTDELPWLACLLFLVLWAVFFWLNRAAVSIPDTKYLRCGIIAGLAGLFIHSAVDFDWYSPVISQSAWLLGGCLIALTYPLAKYRTLKIPVSGGLRVSAALLFLGLALVGLFVIPDLMQAHQLVTDGRDKINASSSDKIREGRHDLELAKGLNPLDPAPWEILGWFYHSYQCLPLERRNYEKIRQNMTHQVPEIKLSLLKENFNDCLKHIDRAIELRPFSSALHAGRGAFTEDHARILDSWVSVNSSTLPADEIGKLKQSALEQSFQSFREAFRLYPTRPANAYRLARAIENRQTSIEPAALADESKKLYRRALELDGLVLQKELGLPPEVREEIKEKLKQ